MKVFTREEIIQLLASGTTIADFINAHKPGLSPALLLAYELQLEITVDEVRAEFGLPPHSDTAVGGTYFWQVANP